MRLMVEKNYSRAAAGGTGEAKTGGNYAGTIIATQRANAKGYSQVLWLDAKEHRYVEEVGTNNIFFVIDGKLVTPPLTGTILPGITRKSVLEMAGDLGLTAEERLLTIEELVEGIDSGKVTEALDPEWPPLSVLWVLSVMMTRNIPLTMMKPANGRKNFSTLLQACSMAQWKINTAGFIAYNKRGEKGAT